MHDCSCITIVVLVCVQIIYAQIIYALSLPPSLPPCPLSQTLNETGLSNGPSILSNGATDIPLQTPTATSHGQSINPLSLS